MGTKFKEYWCWSVIFILLLQIWTIAQKAEAEYPEWLLKIQMIKVFESTKIDVEKIFNNLKISSTYRIEGASENAWGKSIVYQTNFGKLEVEYSTGNCSESRSKYAYNISNDTVVDFTFYPKDKTVIKKLNYDLNTFDYAASKDVINAYTISNGDLGITIFVVEDLIESIQFIHNMEYDNLACAKILKQNIKCN